MLSIVDGQYGTEVALPDCAKLRRGNVLSSMHHQSVQVTGEAGLPTAETRRLYQEKGEGR